MFQSPPTSHRQSVQATDSHCGSQYSSSRLLRQGGTGTRASTSWWSVKKKKHQLSSWLIKTTWWNTYKDMLIIVGLYNPYFTTHGRYKRLNRGQTNAEVAPSSKEGSKVSSIACEIFGIEDCLKFQKNVDERPRFQGKPEAPTIYTCVYIFKCNMNTIWIQYEVNMNITTIYIYMWYTVIYTY